MESQILAGRKFAQSFGLSVDELVKLQERSKKTGRSMSSLLREAIDEYFQRREPLGPGTIHQGDAD